MGRDLLGTGRQTSVLACETRTERGGDGSGRNMHFAPEQESKF